MAWRSLMIQNPAQLSLSKAQLCLKSDDKALTLPLEDITCIILEHPQITLNASLLARCQDLGVCLITCDSKHMPNGILHPFMAHSRQSHVSHMQIECSAPFKKRLWQALIKQKIALQAEVLTLSSLHPEHTDTAQALSAMQKRVKSGDPDNIEAQAARRYWPALFGKDFRRHRNDIINAALNYGYAILRATLARSVAAYGLLPCFGLHHNNKLNAFNLVDDLIEPYRPFVDLHVKTLIENQQLSSKNTLSKEDRQSLAQVLKQVCRFEDGHQSLFNATDRTVSSLVKSIEEKQSAPLTLPFMPDPLIVAQC